MKLRIFRGTNQIGGNIIEVATETTKIILDCGSNLPPLDDTKASDTIDVPGLTSGTSSYNAVFISHHHGDHCGLIGHINDDIHIYTSAATKSVLEIIADFIDKPSPRIYKVIEPEKSEQVGDIKITALPVKHSAWGAIMFLIESGETRILYTGDFNEIYEYDNMELENIDILLCEGTNVRINSKKSETSLYTDVKLLMEQTENEVFVLCSTTNIDRIQAVDSASKSCAKPRTMVIDPFMNAILNNVGYTLESKTIQFLPRGITKGVKPRMDNYISWNNKWPSSSVYKKAEKIAQSTDITVMVRQTMGDFLIRVAGEKVGIKPPDKGSAQEYQEYRNDVVKKKPFSGSTLIYSIWQGYKKTKSTSDFLDLCISLGMKVEDMHVSGHAYRENLEVSISGLKSRTLVPIHTENADTFYEIHDHVILLQNDWVLNCETRQVEIENIEQFYEVVKNQETKPNHQVFETALLSVADTSVEIAFEETEIIDMVCAFQELSFDAIKKIMENLPQCRQLDILSLWSKTPPKQSEHINKKVECLLSDLVS
jgi:ribonuclease J